MNYSLRRDFAEIAPFLDAVRAQADEERVALGFLPAPAYAEAARQKKLIVLLANNGQQTEYAGHLLFGGIFPHLRVRQICVAPVHRRHGNATRLLRALKSQGESEGYLSIVANVATDLQSANSFYENNGFATQRLKSGGLTRKRTINVRTLQLDTPSLITLMTEPPGVIEFIQPRKRSVDVPLYAIDLNVFFDVIKSRPRSDDAGALFKAAFSHQIRLTATDEFVRELERTTHDQKVDPVLALARQIPNLPVQNKETIERLIPVVTSLVFADMSKVLTASDKSDVLHLCHAISAGAAGYITSDGRVLDARDSLMSEFGLDVIALSEFVELLDLPISSTGATIKATQNFRISAANISDVSDFLNSESVSPNNFLEVPINQCDRTCVSDGDGIVGVSLMKPMPAINQSTRSLVCVRQDHPNSSTIADFLISEQLRSCSKKSACTITLFDIAHHPITRRIALTHGFQQAKGTPASLTKIALGYPVTKASWGSARLAVERLGGLKIQENCPQYNNPTTEILSPEGTRFGVQLFELESLLSPTLFALPRRNAVVVPITGEFANALLGTQAQLSFLEVPEAPFLSRRTYFNTTRAANVMIRGSAIAFYESVRSKGRGAIVALARIVEVTTIPTDNVPEFMQRAAVVEDLEEITKGTRVLVTTFDNLIPLKKLVNLSALRQIGCVPASNFVSATSITAAHLEQIVLAGFPNE